MRVQNEKDRGLIDATQVKILKMEFNKEIEEAGKQQEKKMMQYQMSNLKKEKRPNEDLQDESPLLL